MRRLKIGYLTSLDANDKHAWSGTTHYIYKALQEHVGDVEQLGPAQPKFTLFLAKIFQAISIYIFRKRFDFYHSRMVAKAYGKIFSKKLENKKYDLIVAPAGVAFVAYLKTDIPIVLVLDRALGNALNYHSVLTNLWDFSKKQSLETDQKAMQKAALTIFSSEWAAQHAREVYKIEAKKLLVLPFGANLDEIPNVNKIFIQKDYSKIKMFFLGTYWKHKGADIAVNTLDKLLNKGIDAELIIAGCEAPAGFNHKHVTVAGFINKNTEEGKRQLENCFSVSNIFILPTRFEAFGIVFCEAGAWGLISLGTKTGGVPGVITEGINGYLVDVNDTGEKYAELIEHLFRNKDEFKKMGEGSRNHFETHLTWTAWVNGFKVHPLIKNLIEH